ncbi:MAG: leucine-rich repeat protein [Clostridia bacterium]|nr:leucine-rich repeat protein [Clostridia bacterium]
MTFPEKITYLRKKKGWSQEQLSIKLDISRQAIYKWEAGICLPEIDKLRKLSKIYGLSCDDLLNDDIDITSATLNIEANEDDLSVGERATDGDLACEKNQDSPKKERQRGNAQDKGRLLIAFLAVGVILLALVVFLIASALSDDSESGYESGSTSESESAGQGATPLLEFDDLGDTYALKAVVGGGAVEVPSHYNGKPVVAIYNDAFKGNSAITSVSLPEGITSIDKDMFYGCTALSYVKLPSSISYIDVSAFNECPSLLGFEVSEENQDFSSVDGILYNKAKTRLKKYPVGRNNNEVSVPNGTHYIEDFAFYRCSYITKCVLPDGVGGVGVSAFEGCINLKSIDLGNRVDFVGGKAFLECRALESIVFEHELYSIGSNAFASCTSLKRVELMSNVGEIGYRAFYNCKALVAFTAHGEVAKKDKNAFEGCDKLNNFTSDDIIVNPGQECSHSQRLTHERVEPTCESYGESAYEECAYCGHMFSFPEIIEMLPHSEKIIPEIPATCTTEGVTEVIFCEVCQTELKTSAPIPAKGHSYSDGVCLSCGFLKADECLELELVGEADNGYYRVIGLGTVTGDKIDIPSTYNSLPVKEIGDGAFSGCKATAITIPAGIEKIGANAFRLSFISKIEIPSSVKVIGAYAFYDCPSLKDVYIGSGVEKMESSAFHSTSIERVFCPSLTDWCEIEFEDKYANPLYHYTDEFIVGDKALTNLVTEGIKKIPKHCFAGFDKLVTIKISEDTTEIGDGAFYQCVSLISVEIYGAGKTIGFGAFTNCSSIAVVNFYGTLKEWCEMTFKSEQSNPVYCSKSLHLSSEPLQVFYDTSITQIGDYALINCEGLSGINLSSEITKIGAKAFCGCVNVSKLIFNSKSVEDLAYGNNVFKDVGKDVGGVEVIIGKDATRVPSYMLYSNPQWTKSVTFEEDSACAVIGDFAFYECARIKSITLNKNLTKIGKYAFYGCYDVFEITVNSLALDDLEAHNYAFAYVGTGTTGVTVTINDGVSKLPSFMFYPTSTVGGISPHIRTVIFKTENTPLEIGEDAFYGCDKISRVEAKSIKGYLNISFAGGRTNPMMYAQKLYINDDVLTSLVVPEGVSKINDYAFYYCYPLTEAVISKDVCYIGRGAFNQCRSLDFSDVTFENTDGWYRSESGNAVLFDVTDKSNANATLFFVGSEKHFYRVDE